MKNTAFNLVTIKNLPQKKSSDSVYAIAKKILTEFMTFRRVVPQSIHSCSKIDCQKCSSPHLPKIISAVKENKPVTFVLPAFPGKSPNTEKVLGHLPDYAEKLSLNFLGKLCQRIKSFYQPGINIILCSDGRVFSDVVGIKESNVTAYQVELEKLIKEMSLLDISTFNLDDVYRQLNFVQMRDELMQRYGKSLDFLQSKIRNGTKLSASIDEQESNRMYRGIIRFLFEDSQHSEQTKSRTAILNESRSKAYEVIRRSNAWSDLIAEHFPEAVRLSIHPQTCGAKKLGIRLIGNESWMTPWHGVAVESEQGYILLKRSEAEALGAKLIYFADGRPSHYKQTLSMEGV
jgi:pyoverdine/dityrosine biosynthesis protein Dit1